MNRIVKILLAVFLCCCLTACYDSTGSKRYDNTTNLVEIHSRKNLYYDPDTKIVYYLFSENFGSYRGYGYMSAYYAPNGLPYLYDVFNDTLTEIDK